jgi:hypothetical protein
MATHFINEVAFDTEFKLTGPDGEVDVSHQAIKSLSIKDSMYNPFKTGLVQFVDGFYVFESLYSYRGDGRDEFSVMMKPSDEDVTIEETFILFDESNVYSPANVDVRSKTFVLADKKSLPFKETIPYNRTFSGYCGEVLEELFDELLPDYKGTFEKTDLFYTAIPSINWTYMDLLEDILQKNYVAEGSTYIKCFLLWDRKESVYNFTKISELFDKNKDNVIEAFSLGGDQGGLGGKGGFTYGKNPDVSSTPAMEYDSDLLHFNISTPQHGFMSIMNTHKWIINAYNRVLGSHEQGIIKLDDIKKNWEELFVKPFKLQDGEVSGFISENKKSKKRHVSYTMPYDLTICKRMVESEINNILTFHNINCNFTKKGNPVRQSGKFFDVARATAYVPQKGEEEFKFDDKALGRWLLTEVIHTYSNDNYATDIVGVKTYVHPESKPSDSAE